MVRFLSFTRSNKLAYVPNKCLYLNDSNIINTSKVETKIDSIDQAHARLLPKGNGLIMINKQ